MINLLENNAPLAIETFSLEEDELISLIYRFASKKDEWFNLLLSLSNCISISENLPHEHPFRDVSLRVMKHLKTAIKISAQLSSQEHPLQTESSLNHIPMAALIINETGRIIDINERAEHFFNASQHWQIDQGYLSAEHLRLNTELMPLTGDQNFSIISLALEPVDSAVESLSTKKAYQGKPKLVHLTALPGNEADMQLSQHFYLCFQTEQEELINTELLKAHYQLTDTEALVVVTLINELSSKKTATKLKLKEATVRGHLSNIYQKLGVTRKPELIRKVLLYKLGSSHQLDRPLSPIADKTSEPEQNVIYLKDGRRMSYCDHPKPELLKNKRATDPYCSTSSETHAIILLHNLMGSSMELPPGASSLFEQENIRIIVPERPGYGDSDCHPERNHQDWCSDLEQLLDHLKLDKVKILAHSIGGSYALALAEFLPDRIERIAMVNAMPRIEDIMACANIPSLVTAVNRSLKFAPFLIEPILKMAVGKDIEHFYSQQLNYIRPTLEGRAADINLLKTSQYRNYSTANLKQSAKQGVGIWAEELKLSFSALAFSVKNCRTEYQFWHGEHDDVIPLEAAELLSKHLNTTHFTRLKSETHYLFARHFNKIVKQLIAS